jgi:hypothetical protein
LLEISQLPSGIMFALTLPSHASFPVFPGGSMRNRERSIGARLGRALIIIVGVLGALAAFDAVLIVLVLLASAIFEGALNPYIGLLTFVALPFAVAFGIAVAWTAYAHVAGRPSQSVADTHHVGP